jgi:hypothetical protein
MTAPTPSGGNATPDLLTLLKRRDRAWADLQGNPDSYDAMASWEMHDDALRAALLAARRENESLRQALQATDDEIVKGCDPRYLRKRILAALAATPEEK